MAAGPLVVAMSTDASGRRRFRMPDFFYGGQALIEGVMMRGRTTVAMSVRPPSGEIVTMSEPLPAGPLGRPKAHADPVPARGLPAVRDARHRHAHADALGVAGRRGRGRRARQGHDRGDDGRQHRLRHRPLLPPAAVPVDLRRGRDEQRLRGERRRGSHPAGDLHRVHRGHRADERHPARVRLPRGGAQGDQRVRGRSAADARGGRRLRDRAHAVRDDVPADRRRDQHLLLQPDPARRRPAAAAVPVPDRARAGHRGRRVRARPLRRPPLRQPRRPRRSMRPGSGSSR